MHDASGVGVCVGVFVGDGVNVGVFVAVPVGVGVSVGGIGVGSAITGGNPNTRAVRNRSTTIERIAESRIQFPKLFATPRIGVIKGWLKMTRMVTWSFGPPASSSVDNGPPL